MSSITITVEGYVAADPELRHTRDTNRPVTSVSVPHTPRRRNKDSGDWEDAGPTVWTEAQFWDAEAELIAHSVSKGDRVLIHAQGLKLNPYTSTKDGELRASLIYQFPTLAIIQKPQRSARPDPDEQWAPDPGPGGDVWNTPSTPRAEVRGPVSDVPPPTDADAPPDYDTPF